MLRTLLFLCLALTFASCGARRTAEERKDAANTTTARKGRIIALSDTILNAGGTDTIRFGRLRSGEVAVMRFWIENNTSRPTAIISYDRSCGCTTLEFDAQPITPGDARQFPLTFDSRGEHGWQLKVVDISFAGARKPLRLYVEAEVE